MDGRPAKRARFESTDKADHPIQNQVHSFGNINISGSGPVHLGDQHESSKQDFRHNISDSGVDKYEVLLKSLLFDRIDNRVHTIKKMSVSKPIVKEEARNRRVALVRLMNSHGRKIFGTL